MSELGVRGAVAQYFISRSDYLESGVGTIQKAVDPISTDEQTHRSKLMEDGLTWVNSEASLIELVCNEKMATVSVVEIVEFSQNGLISFACIDHQIELYLDDDGMPVIVADDYTEEFSDFCSASYVDESQTATDPMAAGSPLCISRIAYYEVGYTETGTNITKYGEWFGMQDEWCAIFVSWCANQAGVATYVIPKTASVPTMRTFFSDRGTFYYSSNYGGNTNPRVGDLVIKGTSASSASHVGIVVNVSGSTFTYVDGNNDNAVDVNTISTSNTGIVGYCRPSYSSSTHIAGSTWYYNVAHHWHECINCGAQVSAAAHDYNQYDGSCICGSVH